MKIYFLDNGFVKLNTLIPVYVVEKIRSLYDVLLYDKKRTIGLRSDLRGMDTSNSTEKITQIMLPCTIESKLLKSTAYE